MRLLIICLCMVHPLMGQNALDSIPLSLSFDEEVVVTGQYCPTELKTTVLPVRVITKKMIEQRAATNLTEVLQQEATIRIAQDPVLGTVLTMNGLEGKHVQILLDGVPMIGRSDGHLDLDRIQVQNIERIEIIENAMSVTYGTNALAGTIHIITKKAAGESWDARVSGQVQSNGQYLASAALGGHWKGFGGDLTYNWSHFNGFSTDTLRSQPWNPKRQHAVSTRLYYKLPSGAFTFSYQFHYLNEAIDDKGNVKLGAFPSLSYAKDYQFTTNTHEHSIAALGYLDKKKRYYLDVLGAFNSYNRTKNAYFRSLYNNEKPDTLDPLDSDTTAFQAWNVRAIIATQYRKKLDFQAGIDFRYDYTSGARIGGKQAELGNWALFVNLRYKPFAKLTLDAGLRLAYNTLAKFPVTYSAGAKWNLLDGMYLNLSYARGIRTPSLKELYLDFVDVNHNIQGNPNLKPEYAHNLRLGWTYNKAYFGEHIVNLNLGLFYNNIDQQIALFSYDLDSLGHFVMNPQSTNYGYFNLDSYQNWGINSSLKYQYKGLSIRFGISLIGHYNSLNKEAPERIQPFQYTAEFSQEISYQFKKIDLTLSLFRRDYDQQLNYTAVTNPQTQEVEIVQTKLDGYGLMDVTIAKGFWKKGLVLSLGVKNLLNISNISQSGTGGAAHSSGNGSQAVAMGRIFFCRLVCQPFKMLNRRKK